VNSGKMLVGNLGSKYRFAYGVLGDDVNLGSRLEGLNRTFGTSIIVGQGTAELVGEAFVMRELDRVRAKGKRNALGVHELVARTRSELTPDQRSVLDLYAAGLVAYRRRRWAEAASRFGEALRIAPEDGPSLTMVERCRLYERAAPPEAWDGVFEQTLQMLKDVG
jgi:adenylate cyclase